MIETLRNQLGSIRKVYLKGNTIQKHNDFAEFPETVLLLHGFFQTRNIWEIMENRLRRDNYGVLSLDLGGLFWRFNTRSINKQGKFLAEKMDRIAARYDLQNFHIIGHSMGGLVARHYIQYHGGDRRVKSLITLGTPHLGTPTALIGFALMWGGMLSNSPSQMLPNSSLLRQLRADGFPPHIPLTSIFSRHDFISPWWGSVLYPSQGETNINNIQIPHLGHSELTYSNKVYKHVKEQLIRSSELFQVRHGKNL
ncbi:MAG: permease [Proteobacteria bacterium]|nr:permease [Pseudomonadota bacterium]